MKRFYGKAGKVFLCIACTTFTFLLIISFAASAILGNWGLFSGNSSEFQTELNRIAGSNYAAWVIDSKDDGFTSGRIQGMNCYYGVISGRDIDDLDLNADSTYIYRNFKDVKVPKDAYINFYGIDDDTEIDLSDKLIDVFTPNYISTNYQSVYTAVDIEGIGYDVIGQKAYVYGNGRFYPIQEYYYNYRKSDATSGTPNTNKIYEKIWANNKTSVVENESVVEYDYAAEDSDETTYVVEEEQNNKENKNEAALEENEVTTEYLPEETVIYSGANGSDDSMLYIAGTGYKPLSSSVTGYVLAIESDDGASGKLSLDNVADLSEIHGELSKLEYEVSLDDISSIGIYEDNPGTEYYTFVCFPNESKLAANTYTNDFYAQAKAIVGMAPTLKYMLPMAVVISLIGALGCWIMFLKVAGHKKGFDGIYEGPIEKIPADVAFAVACFAELVVLCSMIAFVNNVRAAGFGLIAMLLAIGCGLAMIIGFLWSSNIAVNVKLRHVWKNSLINKIFRIIKRWFSGISEETKQVRSIVKWTYRIWAIFAVITFIELMIIAITGSEGILLFCILEKIGFVVILRKLLKSYAKIKGTALALAEGDTSAKVDLNGMPLFMEEHARAMNDIQSGITVALEERTKSERMKTELITNVSHDIKTPLTSIINYVDLLEKEEIDNTNAKEYLEVLDRQSKRLKKLIEDLIEASKVSTGNIKFNFEKVNAATLLNQSIGEFTDRLEANNIGIVTSLPEKEVYLQADNRYLWRVFDNLMSNIVKYAQPNTRAYVTLEETGNKLCFTFRNTSKEELNISPEELMERFVRGDKSRYTDGNGLGLSIAKSLTEAMGGNMKLAIDGDLFKASLEFETV